MHKLGWFIIAGILGFFATLGLMNAVYWIIIGHDVEHPFLIAGTFVIPIILYFLAYASWEKAREKKV